VECWEIVWTRISSMAEINNMTLGI
jgi:hypothetical protein